MTHRGGREALEKWDRGGREAVGDGATCRLVEAFQFGDIGLRKDTIRVRHK